MKTLTLTADESKCDDGYYSPKRTIIMEFTDDVAWMNIVDGLRDALNGLGYVVPELGDVSEAGV